MEKTKNIPDEMIKKARRKDPGVYHKVYQKVYHGVYCLVYHLVYRLVYQKVYHLVYDFIIVNDTHYKNIEYRNRIKNKEYKK